MFLKGLLDIIVSIIASFFLSAIDTYLPFIPPATPSIAGLIFLSDANLYYVQIILCGIAMGLGTALALFILRTIEGKIIEKIKEKQKKGKPKGKISKFQEFISAQIGIFVEVIGYQSVIIFHALGLGAPIAYIYLFSNHVNYYKYTITSIIGRTMLLSLLIAITKLTDDNSLIFLICVALVYIFVIIYTCYKLFRNRKEIKNAYLKSKVERNKLKEI